MNPIGQLATSVVETEFDYITGTEKASLLSSTSGWLGANVGMLNVLINTSFNSGNICALPETGAKASGWIWQPEEEAIYKQVFLQEYYNKEARKILRNTVSTTQTSGTTSSDYTLTEWTSLREGDTQIQRQAIILSASQKNEASRIVRGFAQDATDELKRLIHNYNMYQAVPRQVAGNDGEPA
tara:strand:+ start:1697 stop:2245 length:549 start_codon:yes stop_codon:yes gene_type:complete